MYVMRGDSMRDIHELYKEYRVRCAVACPWVLEAFFFVETEDDIILKFIDFSKLQFTKSSDVLNITIPNFVTKIGTKLFVGISENLCVSWNNCRAQNISGLFASYMGKKITFTMSGNTDRVECLSRLCDGCTNLEQIELGGSALLNVTDVSGMFWDCRNLEKVNMCLGCSIADSSYMFCNCAKLKQVDLTEMGIQLWNCENTCSMFKNCVSLEKFVLDSHLGLWQCKDASMMFYNCPKIKELNLSNLLCTVGKSVGAELMFHNCGVEYLDVHKWDFCSIRDGIECLYECKSLKHLWVGNNLDVEFDKDRITAKIYIQYWDKYDENKFFIKPMRYTVTDKHSNIVGYCIPDDTDQYTGVPIDIFNKYFKEDLWWDERGDCTVAYLGDNGDKKELELADKLCQRYHAYIYREDGITKEEVLGYNAFV